MDIIIQKLTDYVSSLDWTYIISFILLAWIFSKDTALTSWFKEGADESVKSKVRKFLLKVPKTIRIMLIGLVYAIVLHSWRKSSLNEGSKLNDTEQLFQSFLFAIAFHSLLLKQLAKWMGAKLTNKLSEGGL